MACLITLVMASCLVSCSSDGGRSLGSVGGHVRDMLSLLPIVGADVLIGDASGTTDAEGHFFLSVESGDLPVTIEDGGYVTLQSSISVDPAQHVDLDFELFPLPVTRVVLTWADEPVNLDLHAWVPMGTGTYDHIWRGDYGDADAPPYTMLDADVTTGHGPESVYIRPGIGDYYAGYYHFAVQHAAGGLSLPESQARVDIYRGNQLHWTIRPPSGSAQVGWYWYVGKLNCRTLQWTEVGTYSEEPPLPDA
jgi:hypothetical protein